MSEKHKDKDTLERMYHREGLSLSQVGSSLGVCVATILYWMNRHGIARRPPPAPVFINGLNVCSRCKQPTPAGDFYANRARSSGTGIYCKTCEKASSRPFRVSEEGRKGSRGRAKLRRMTIIEALGGKCACCGETQFEFLQYDHIHANGAEHRRRLGRNIYPSDVRKDIAQFQLLCANCNFAKGRHSECPHQEVIRGLFMVA